MLVYRLVHPIYASDLTGYGSLLVPGRWNFKGHRVLYTAENSSLALLEYLAHTEGIQRRLPYQLITIEIPNSSIKKLSPKSLATSWQEDIFTTREIGSQWLLSRKTLALKVPSALNEDNSNFLINPEHNDFVQTKIIKSKEITFDQRFW
jgi:RES domain-containing protein